MSEQWATALSERNEWASSCASRRTLLTPRGQSPGPALRGHRRNAHWKLRRVLRRPARANRSPWASSPVTPTRIGLRLSGPASRRAVPEPEYHNHARSAHEDRTVPHRSVARRHPRLTAKVHVSVKIAENPVQSSALRDLPRHPRHLRALRCPEPFGLSWARPGAVVAPVQGTARQEAGPDIVARSVGASRRAGPRRSVRASGASKNTSKFPMRVPPMAAKRRPWRLAASVRRSCASAQLEPEAVTFESAVAHCSDISGASSGTLRASLSEASPCDRRSKRICREPSVGEQQSGPEVLISRDSETW